MDKQSLELLLARGESIEGIAKRFGKDPSTVSYWMKKHGLTSPYAEKHAARGGIERGRLEALVEAGMSIAEIAEALGRSKATVRHWLRRYELRTLQVRRRAARDAGQLTIELVCPHHGRTVFWLEGRGSYRCKRCRAESVVRHRQKVKALLVAEAGGCCVLCGYNRNVRVLQFHHRDPSSKRLGLSGHGVAYSIDTLRAEARKCVLLCANCHAEVEAGASQLPLECAPTGSKHADDPG